MLNNNKIGWRLEHSFATLSNFFHRSQLPVPVRAPELVIFNEELATELGLDFHHSSNEDIAAIFSGNHLPQSAEPLTQAYAGHQFGYLNILGDGRAVLLGEQLAPNKTLYDIQLKGSGVTAFSRNGDGRAALGPMLREFVISEAMHHLKIPTTRSLCVVSTGEAVRREKYQPGAILTRVASSHLRVGTFEYAALHGRIDMLKELVGYAINRHYPHLKESDNPALDLLKAVCDRQVNLMVEWSRVGFIHGVMNTDNMTISGETIDYGPCAFMNHYDPATVFSSIDQNGRYAFSNQPIIAHWNLARFAEALLPLLDQDQRKAIAKAEEAICDVHTKYERRWGRVLLRKIGLTNSAQTQTEQEKADLAFANELLDILEEKALDYTHIFKILSLPHPENSMPSQMKSLGDWFVRWQQRIEVEAQPKTYILEEMQKVNPAVIPRNHKVEQALEKAEYGEMEQFNEMLDILSNPYDYETDKSQWENIEDIPKYYQTFCGT